MKDEWSDLQGYMAEVKCHLYPETGITLKIRSEIESWPHRWKIITKNYEVILSKKVQPFKNKQTKTGEKEVVAIERRDRKKNESVHLFWSLPKGSPQFFFQSKIFFKRRQKSSCGNAQFVAYFFVIYFLLVNCLMQNSGLLKH